MSELDIGGSNMTVELRDDTNTLYAKANTGNKQWVAVITDTHPEYNYERDFVAYQKPRTSDRDKGTATVDDGAVIERVRYTHSGKNRKDRFYQLVDGEVCQIDEVDVVAALEGEIVPDVGTEPEDPDEWDTESAITEIHECEECGDEFDSAHGVAVHAGIVHSEGEEDSQETSTDADSEPVAVADGGLQVREYRTDVEHTDDEVRHYGVPGSGFLYAYRSDDGEHHVVVSRGDEPNTRWEKRVPATVERPVPGQQLWTIPDNWQKRAVSKRDSIAYGLFYVPESDVWARVSIPTNNWLIDAWYSVKAVGQLDAEPVGELGSGYEVRQLADEFEEDEVEGGEDDAELFREIARNWKAVEKDLEVTTDIVRDEKIPGEGDQPIHTDRDWKIEFHQERVFRPGETIKREVDLSEYEMPLAVVHDELRDAGLLPDCYTFELVIDGSEIDMEYITRGLIEAGASAAEAVDYYMVELADMTQTAWAEERGVDQSTVSGNVSGAKRVLQT